jgi:hypothetical protein
MGYICLMQSRKTLNDYDRVQISKYRNANKINIPIINNDIKEGLVSELKLQEITYSEALATLKIDQEYCNDCEKSGYVIGIEMNLSKERFFDLLKNDGFVLYKDFKWKGNKYNILTFDFFENVFCRSNLIYPLTKDKDSFLIVQVEKKYRIGRIKALITNNEKIYPFEYLKELEFSLFDE